MIKEVKSLTSKSRVNALGMYSSKGNKCGQNMFPDGSVRLVPSDLLLSIKCKAVKSSRFNLSSSVISLLKISQVDLIYYF